MIKIKIEYKGQIMSIPEFVEIKIAETRLPRSAAIDILAERSGGSRASIYRWLAGKPPSSIEKLEKLEKL